MGLRVIGGCGFVGLQDYSSTWLKGGWVRSSAGCSFVDWVC